MENNIINNIVLNTYHTTKEVDYSGPEDGPNMSSVYLKITGNYESLDKFFTDHGSDWFEQNIFFDTLMPIEYPADHFYNGENKLNIPATPSHLPDYDLCYAGHLYDNAIQTYGTYERAQDCEGKIINNESDIYNSMLEYSFWTFWMPPIPWLKYIGTLLPELKFYMEYEIETSIVKKKNNLENPFRGGKIVIENGIVIEESMDV